MLEIMLFVNMVLLMVSGLFMTVIGAITMIHILRPKKSPMDSSNRINHIRLWWFALTRPELFTPFFTWLKNDEYDNMKKD